MSDWEIIRQKLQTHPKAELIDLIKELTALSPSVQQFLQARYVHSKSAAARTKPYNRRIEAQFAGEELWPDFQQIEQVIQEYQHATRQEPQGTAELYVNALENAAGFVWGMGVHDVEFFNDLTHLSWQCVAHFTDFPDLYPLYKDRLQTITAKLIPSSDEGLTEPFYQLEADMDSPEELL